jgi:predicted pyridoxine 5'-phosphate oxidase superfamily flavin-nucleotide-binding protein
MREDRKEELPRRPSRRSFAKTLAAAAIAAPALAAAASAQKPPATAEPKAPPGPQPTPQPQQPPKPSPTAEAYAEVARARFGEHISAEQLEAVKRDLEGNVRTAERLRAFKLQNSDEPDFVFSA